MKKRVICSFLIVLVLLISFSFAKEVNVPEASVPDSQLVTDETNYYALLGNEVVASVNNGEVEYLHKDRLGSNIVSSNGNIERSKTLPFGEKISNDGIKYSFTGKEQDLNGLYYFGARYYNPDSGRFIETDPVKNNHPYVYTNNNPLAFVDPTGDEIKVYDSLMEELKKERIGFEDLLKFPTIKKLHEDSKLYVFKEPNEKELALMENDDVAGMVFRRDSNTAVIRTDLPDKTETRYFLIFYEARIAPVILHEAIHLSNNEEFFRFIDKIREIQFEYRENVNGNVVEKIIFFAEEIRTNKKFLKEMQPIRSSLGSPFKIEFSEASSNEHELLRSNYEKLGGYLEVLSEQSPEAHEKMLREVDRYMNLN